MGDGSPRARRRGDLQSASRLDTLVPREGRSPGSGRVTAGRTHTGLRARQSSGCAAGGPLPLRPTPRGEEPRDLLPVCTGRWQRPGVTVESMLMNFAREVGSKVRGGVSQQRVGSAAAARALEEGAQWRGLGLSSTTENN